MRQANDGRPPNIVYILLDDVGYGEIGTPDLTPSRGYSTPNIDAFARQGLTFGRMYSEPSCTPTRVAMMTGRLPVRTGTTEAKATIAGDGLAADEVTLAEVLREAGYYTSHVGKWHMGDIKQAYASEQGFMHGDAASADVIRGSDPTAQLQTFTLDNTAYMRWPAAIDPGTYAQDIIHVSDLNTTFARIAGALDEVPTDRVIDGVDQSGLLLLGETHGRRDYVFIYDGPNFKAAVKNKYKMHMPPPGTNPIGAPIFDLYRDPREERPTDSIKYGPWAGGQFANMVKRHMAYKQKYPDRPPVYAMPYEGIEDLRPETQEVLRIFSLGRPKK